MSKASLTNMPLCQEKVRYGSSGQVMVGEGHVCRFSDKSLTLADFRLVIMVMMQGVLACCWWEEP